MIKTIDLNFLQQEKTIAAFLYETAEGPILFETGPHSCFEALCAGIRAHGHEPKDIKHVFLTHIHLDHAGAAWAFAEMGAKIYTHPIGKPHLVDPSKLLDSAGRIYGDKMQMLWGDLRPIEKRMVVMLKDAETRNIGGTTIRAWHTPGHAKHHIAYQVNRELIAGDVGGIKIDGGPAIPPCPPPDINVADWNYSIRRMKALDLNRIHLTHFGSVVNISSHLDELSRNLDLWADWMKPFVEDQTPTDKVIPLFEEFVTEQLRKAGLDEIAIQAYEKANPAWMSVTGLKRYWTKEMKLI